MKKILAAVLILVVALSLVGCGEMTAEQKIAEEQALLVQEANDTVGMPDIRTFQEKKLAKEIQELRDIADLVCYAYTKNEMTGKYVFEGQCIGFGLPYAVQYTNPDMTAKGYYSGETVVIAQADPNGLYMPETAEATWLMMINEESGKREIEYYENKLTITQSKKPARLCEEWSLPDNY